MNDDDKASLGGEEEEEEEEEKAAPRRSRPRRSSIGLRVALQFPAKKLAEKSDQNSCSEPLFSSSHLQDNKKAILGRKKSCRQGKEREDSASESEDDSRDEGQETSDALLKRTMNIKENKAMVRPCVLTGSLRATQSGPLQLLLLWLLSGKVLWGVCVRSLFLNPTQFLLDNSGLRTETPHTIFSCPHCAVS